VARTLYAYADGNPINNTDPFGLYATPWHYIFSYVAMLLSGENPIDALHAAGADSLSDFNWYNPGTQDPANANWHSMAQPGQSQACARAGAQSFINTQIGTGTLRGLGEALHAKEDSFARGHGYAVWDGNLTWLHVWQDWTPTPNEMLNAIRSDMQIIQDFNHGGQYSVPGAPGCGCR